MTCPFANSKRLAFFMLCRLTLTQTDARHYSRPAFAAMATASEIAFHAHPSTGPRDCHRLSVRRDRAWHSFSPRAKGCARLFSRRAHGSLVGPRILHRRHGNLHTYHHRHTGYLLWRKSHLPPTGLRLSHWSRTDRLAASSRLFSDR